MLVRFGLIKHYKFAALSFAILPKISLFITFFKIIVFINICKKDGFVTEADPIRFIVLWRFSVDRWRRWKNAGVSRNILIRSRRYANLGFWKRISVVRALWGSKVIKIWRIYVSACLSMHASVISLYQEPFRFWRMDRAIQDMRFILPFHCTKLT